MALSNAERQRRFISRLKERAGEQDVEKELLRAEIAALTAKLAQQAKQQRQIKSLHDPGMSANVIRSVLIYQRHFSSTEQRGLAGC
jgi:molybdopterin converting factor small subunit